MSSLLDKLQKDGSQLSGLDGKSSPIYTGESQYQKDLATSQLDLDGKTPLSYTGVSKYQENLDKSQLDVGVIKAKYQYFGAALTNYKKGLATSQLDLDGETPSKYKNPETGATY
jgi:hypothetical protein